MMKCTWELRRCLKADNCPIGSSAGSLVFDWLALDDEAGRRHKSILKHTDHWRRWE